MKRLKVCNLFIIGAGTIGRELIYQIESQKGYLKKKYNIVLKITALANSKKMLFVKKGIPKKWRSVLENSKSKMDIHSFIKKMEEIQFDTYGEHCIFIDNTADLEITKYYEKILKKNISIATPNKIANTLKQKKYDSLRKIASERRVHYLYETNVGAGLPIINTLNNLINSGDEIIRVKGVFSGSLSYIFNSYDGKKTFCDVVFDAKKKGFTEPDPREDLTGMDIARKILILSREIGMKKELTDVKIENILPKSCLQAKNIEEFKIELTKEESFFKKKLQQAQKKKAKIRYIACIEKEHLSIQLKFVNQDDPFFYLSGSENMIVFKTHRYNKIPLLIRGPGAGGSVTASGVFSNIISIANS